MKFTSTSLFLAATALLGASGSIADEVFTLTNSDIDIDYPTPSPNAFGCSEGSCWSSCTRENRDGEVKNIPDPGQTWEEGLDWCWLVKMNQDPDVTTWTEWAECSETGECNAFSSDSWCDMNDENSCSPH